MDDLPFLAALTHAERADIGRYLLPTSLPAGARIFEAGCLCQSYVLVRSGRVRIHQVDPEGREVVLYRIGPGETCVLNSTALMASEPYAAYAIAETDMEAFSLPAHRFAALVDASRGFAPWCSRRTRGGWST